MSVLVTGGAGFIGSRLAHRLLADGHHVVVADVLHPQVHAEPGWPTALPAEVERYPVDVTSAAQCDALLKVVRPDVVVHLAAETGTGQSLTEASRHGSVNVVGTTQLLDAMTRAGHVPEHVLLASSRAVYGEGQWRSQDGEHFYAAARGAQQLAAGRWDPLPPSGADVAVEPCPHRAGTTEPRPSNVYAATKLAQEHVLAAWTSAMGAQLSVLRLQNVYGVGQSLTNSYTGILNIFAQRALAGEPIDVYEDGRIGRDFVFVDDVVEAMALALGRTTSQPVLADVGSAEATTLLEVAELLARLTGSPEPVVSGRYRLGDVRSASADLSAAQAQLGYQPATGLKEGLSALLAWIEETRRMSDEPGRVVYFVSAYQSGQQLVRLVDALRAGRESVPIVIHHDAGAAPMREEVRAQLGDAHVMSCPYPINWGDVTLDRARWDVMAWILENHSCEWVVFLSEQDYPLVCPESFERDLQALAADAVIDAAPLDELSHDDWWEADRRYSYRYTAAPPLFAVSAPAPGGDTPWTRLRSRLRTRLRNGVNGVQKRFRVYDFAVAGLPTLVGRRTSPPELTPSLQVWYGSAWMALSSRACRYVLDVVDDHPELVDYFAHTVIPVESATQSIVGSAPHLRTDRRPLHYVRWSDSSSGRPDVLTLDDLPELLASGLPFARKVDAAGHADLLDAIDARSLDAGRVRLVP